MGNLSRIVGKKEPRGTCMIDGAVGQRRHACLSVTVHLYIKKVYTLTIVEGDRLVSVG